MTLDEFNSIIPKEQKNCIVLNQKQTALLLGVSSSTLENWRKNALGLSYIKINNGKKGRVMYSKENILNFINSNSIVVA